MIEIYTKQDCPYCTHAKRLLRDRQIPFVEYKLNEDFTKDVLNEKFPEAKTFPVVVVDGFRIGGFIELKEKVAADASITQRLLTEGEFNGN